MTTRKIGIANCTGNSIFISIYLLKVTQFYKTLNKHSLFHPNPHSLYKWFPGFQLFFHLLWAALSRDRQLREAGTRPVLSPLQPDIAALLGDSGLNERIEGRPLSGSDWDAFPQTAAHRPPRRLSCLQLHRIWKEPGRPTLAFPGLP